MLCPLPILREDTLLQPAAFSPSLPHSYAPRPALAQQLHEPPAPQSLGSGPLATPSLIPLSGPPQPIGPPLGHLQPPGPPLGPPSGPPLGPWPSPGPPPL